jgi:DNA-directed RNA polymerase specialized sigma24 family protein
MVRLVLTPAAQTNVRYQGFFTRLLSFRQRRVDAIGQLSNPETPAHSVAASQDRAKSGGETTASPRRAQQRQTRLTQPQVDDLVEQRVAGATIADLAELFDIHRTTVMAHLQRHANR